MLIDFHQLALLALLGTAVHWLFARSAIMKWFWDLRWWPQWEPISLRDETHKVNNVLRELFSRLLACTACAGFWLGLGAGVLNIRPIELGPGWLNILGAGLTGIVTVPILEGILIWGLKATRIE